MFFPEIRNNVWSFSSIIMDDEDKPEDVSNYLAKNRQILKVSYFFKFLITEMTTGLKENRQHSVKTFMPWTFDHNYKIVGENQGALTTKEVKKTDNCMCLQTPSILRNKVCFTFNLPYAYKCEQLKINTIYMDSNMACPFVP